MSDLRGTRLWMPPRPCRAVTQRDPERMALAPPAGTAVYTGLQAPVPAPSRERWDQEEAGIDLVRETE
ncbi:hypothetical protein GCM10010433_69150 [Streptomyces pulveraceus]